ncbi:MULTISPECIES: SpdD-like protein [unclassified Streptomyces]|uniref:SpdD-like protein n=1 Tax=unclassified Streptomyces TaxID=2593676 RepID=UPI00278C3447|nr:MULTISPECIES: SpdD-like protein [unclassified Streptomyces]
MFKPRIPVNERPTGEMVPTITTLGAVAPYENGHGSCGCQHHPPTPVAPTTSRPVARLTPGALALAAVGGVLAVLTVGAVLVSMLLAVAITAASLAVVALVARSILTTDTRRR